MGKHTIHCFRYVAYQMCVFDMAWASGIACISHLGLGIHLRCKVANQCLNVCKSVEVLERNKDGTLPSSNVL